MNTSYCQRVADLFQAALQQEPGARDLFLARECADNPDLLQEVLSLLKSDAEAEEDGFWRGSAIEAEAACSVRETDVAGQTIGPYKLLRVIGSGGMGTVCLGIRDDTEYDKCVAVKLIKRGMDTDLVVQRFRNERQILANLEHPNIARLLDGGSTSGGLPYLVMEYIDGEPITEYAARHHLSPYQRLTLFRTVCAAVEYAHQNRVLHRDLKPSNILVTADGTPKLLDFGIARLLGPNEADATVTVLRFLTPEYASPEQVRGEALTKVSDVYSLGVLLYLLLTGARSYRVKSQQPEELATAICQQEPEKPSAVFNRETAAREKGATKDGVDSSKLRGRLEGDIDNIVLMAMRKEPGRRYASVAELSEDIRRYLERLPVTAHRDTFGYRAGKFVRRNAMAVAAASLLLLSLLGGIVGTTWQAHVARAERARAERRFSQVRKLANSFLFEFHDSLEKIPGTLAARQLILKRALEYLDNLAHESSDDRALQSELAESYDRVGTLTWDVQAALAAHRKALAINQELARAEPSNRKYRSQLSGTYNLVGAALKDAGDTAASLDATHRAVDLMLALSKEDPTNVKYLADLSDGYVEMSIILERNGRVDEALDTQYKALAIQQSLLKTGENAENRRLIMNTHLMIARGLTDNGEFKAAMQETLKSRESAEAFNAIDPRNAVYQRDLWITQMRTGGLMLRLGNPSGALPEYRNALASISQLSAADPGDKGHKRGLAVTYLALADTLAALKSGEAVENYDKAIAVSQALLAADPNKPETQDDLANMDTHLANWLASSGSFAHAEELLNKARTLLETAVQRDPGNTRTQCDQAETYVAIAQLQSKLALRETTPAAKLARWRTARDFYAKGISIWARLRNQGLLWRVDAEKPTEAMRAEAACEAAIAKVPSRSGAKPERDGTDQ